MGTKMPVAVLMASPGQRRSPRKITKVWRFQRFGRGMGRRGRKSTRLLHDSNGSQSCHRLLPWAKKILICPTPFCLQEAFRLPVHITITKAL